MQTRIAVPIPSASNTSSRFDECDFVRLKSGFKQLNRHNNAAEASARDEELDATALPDG
jgi:hypothetical protein